VFLLNVAGGGSVAMTAGSTLPDFADLTVNGATFSLNGTSQTIDQLAGTGTVNNNHVNAATLTVGAQNGSSTFAGTLANGVAALGLTKIGSGKLTLTGTNTYTGISTIDAGVIEAATSTAFVGLSGQVRFGGGTLHVTGNSTAANIANKFTTSYSGATAADSGTFDVDAGVTLTIGGPQGASMQTNGAGAHGGTFIKTGGGTLRVLSNNGQLDDPFKLNAGTVIVESATALGGADNANNRVEMKNGTTLVLRQDTSTSFLTPISIVDAGATANVVIDRLTSGLAPAHALNGLSSVGNFSLVVTRGGNVTSGSSSLLLGAVTLGGNGTFNVGGGADMGVTGSLGGAFGVTKSGPGILILGGANSYTGATNVVDGTLALASNLTTSPSVNVTSGVLRIAPNQMRVIKTSALTVGGGAKLDITDNKLIVSGGDAAAIGASIAAARHSGAWDGSGITTSVPEALSGRTTVGVAPAQATGHTGRLFAGVPVAAGDVLVMYTYAGDANLDSTIDAGDYGVIDNFAQVPGAAGYWNGDFNHDGFVDAGDYGLIDNNVQAQGAPIPT
jgi:autotransporter-associated beta strand protein